MNYNKTLNKILSLYKRQKYRETQTLAQKILKIYPKSCEVWYLLALCESQLENFEEALKAFRHSAKKYQSISGWHIDYANLLFSLSKLKEAHAHYQEVIELTSKKETYRFSIQWHW